MPIIPAHYFESQSSPTTRGGRADPNMYNAQFAASDALGRSVAGAAEQLSTVTGKINDLYVQSQVQTIQNQFEEGLTKISSKLESAQPGKLKLVEDEFQAFLNSFEGRHRVEGMSGQQSASYQELLRHTREMARVRFDDVLNKKKIGFAQKAFDDTMSLATATHGANALSAITLPVRQMVEGRVTEQLGRLMNLAPATGVPSVDSMVKASEKKRIERMSGQAVKEASFDAGPLGNPETVEEAYQYAFAQYRDEQLEAGKPVYSHESVRKALDASSRELDALIDKAEAEELITKEAAALQRFAARQKVAESFLNSFAASDPAEAARLAKNPDAFEKAFPGMGLLRDSFRGRANAALHEAQNEILNTLQTELSERNGDVTDAKQSTDAAGNPIGPKILTYRRLKEWRARGLLTQKQIDMILEYRSPMRPGDGGERTKKNIRKFADLANKFDPEKDQFNFDKRLELYTAAGALNGIQNKAALDFINVVARPANLNDSSSYRSVSDVLRMELNDASKAWIKTTYETKIVSGKTVEDRTKPKHVVDDEKKDRDVQAFFRSVDLAREFFSKKENKHASLKDWEAWRGKNIKINSSTESSDSSF